MNTLNMVQAAGRDGLRWKRPATVATALVVALAVTGCTKDSSTSTAGGDSTDTIRTTINANPDSLLAFTSSSGAALQLSNLLYATLVYQGDDNTIVPGLASKWDVTPAGGTFTVRNGATCADDTPITASVVKDSLTAFADPTSGSQYASTVFGPGQPQITADDTAGTVTIELAQPWSDMLRGLTVATAGIVCPAGLENPQKAATGGVLGAFSGPYTLSKVSPGVSYGFTLRDDYNAWPMYEQALSGKPAKHITYSVDGNGDSIANGLLTNTLDIVPLEGSAELRFEGKSEYSRTSIPVASLYGVFNQAEGRLFADEKYRTAVAKVLDPVAFRQTAGAGLGELSTTLVPESVACASTDKSLLIEQDISAAKKVLKGVTIKMVGTQAIGPNGAGNTYVATALREAGAKVELRNVDNTTWGTSLLQKPDSWDLSVDAVLNPARTMYGGLARLVGPLPGEGGRNISGTTKPDIVDLVTKAMGQSANSERCGTYQQIQRIMLSRADFVPLVQGERSYIGREGFSIQAINGTIIPLTMRITK